MSKYEFREFSYTCKSKFEAPIRSKPTAVTRIRTGVAAATTQSTNHYTITAGRLRRAHPAESDGQGL
ncbi:hypothetical protein F2P81_023320 [Scophthalmus maximus]|uniref:Uncharacterized protein n=1 Tax=Scophthalmus maximus TaxID=52904 RepID=A0A6A4RX75_SCOMX|nr:hypothetical protein F2P81_023320 [Scophthalmus maximus]